MPISPSNNFHVGNETGPGLDLVSDLMSGVVFFPGTRYSISGLDLAMMQDMGMAVAVPVIPEPETYALILVGLGYIGASVRLRRRRSQRMEQSARTGWQ